MPIGTVKFFNTEKGYGLIANEDGSGDSWRPNAWRWAISPAPRNPIRGAIRSSPAFVDATGRTYPRLRRGGYVAAP